MNDRREPGNFLLTEVHLMRKGRTKKLNHSRKLDSISSTAALLNYPPTKENVMSLIEVGYWKEGVAGRREILSSVGKIPIGQKRALLKMLSNPKRTLSWRGFSKCRICGKLNGTRCFMNDEFKWPEGYLHYVTAHGVRPPDAMLQYAMSGAKA
jgi:hypothetical protein